MSTKSMVLRRRRVVLPSVSRQTLRYEAQRYTLLLTGIFLGALGYVMFQIPHHIAAGGITGIALIVGEYVPISIGTLYWILNVPMIAMGYRVLGGWKFVARTLLASTIFAVTVDIMLATLPTMLESFPVTDNMVLNTVYGGLIGGIGGGLIYRSGSSLGGTGVLALVVQRKTGWPLSQIYLIDDGLIIVALGIVFGWEIALFGLLMLLLNGMASDFTMEGASTTRTATIISNYPDRTAAAVMSATGHGASYWEITGAYTGEKRYMIMCTVYRTQVTLLKQTVAQVDPEAFVTIGISHQALGEGFGRLARRI